MLRLYLARHGRTVWNQEGRNQGQGDSPLDAVGVLQSQCLAEHLASLALTDLYSSDLGRCLQTAATVGALTNLQPKVDTRLRERDYGGWEGITASDAERSHPEEWRAYRQDPSLHAPPGGESGIEVFMRANHFLFDLLSAHREGAVAIVAHGGVLAAMCAALLHGTPKMATCIRVPNCSVTEIEIDELGRRRLVRFNDVEHLKSVPSEAANLG